MVDSLPPPIVDDSGSFETLFSYYYPGLVVYANRMTGNQVASEDIVQDVFFKLWKNRRRVLPADVKSYLFASVRNTCLNYLQQLKVRNDYQQKVIKRRDVPGSLTWEHYVESELAVLIEQAIARLPAQRQKIFRMNRFEFKTAVQIAQELNLSPRTVQRHLDLALHDLRGELSKYLPAAIMTMLIISAY